GAVTRRDHPVTLLLQDLAGEIAEAGLVFDEEEGLDTAGYLGPDGRGLALGGSAGDPREVDGEARPLVRGAVDGDVALALLDDAVHGGEAQAGALARSLGGEERLEEPLHGHLVHAHPGVDNAQHHELAGPRAGVAAHEGVAQVDVGRLDGDPAPLGIASRALTTRFISTCSI